MITTTFTRCVSSTPASLKALTLPSVVALANGAGWPLDALLSEVGQGSGYHGTVTKADAQAFLAANPAPHASTISTSASAASPAAPASASASASAFNAYFPSTAAPGADEATASPIPGYRVSSASPANTLPPEQRYHDEAASAAHMAHAAAVSAAKAAAPAIYAAATPDIGPLASMLGVDLASSAEDAGGAGFPLPAPLVHTVLVAAAQALRSVPALNARWDADGAPGSPVAHTSVNMLVHSFSDAGLLTSTVIPKAEAKSSAAVGSLLAAESGDTALAPTFAVSALAPLAHAHGYFGVAPPMVANLTIGAVTSSVVPDADSQLKRVDNVALTLTADACAVGPDDLTKYMSILEAGIANPMSLLK